MTELPKLGVNHPVFTILLEENPKLFTTEGLETLLMDCVWRTSTKYQDRIKSHKSVIHDGISSEGGKFKQPRHCQTNLVAGEASQT